MRIKKYFLPCFLPVIAVLYFVLLAPAFADMNKVDEAELARTNASVTGESVKDQIAGVEKGVVIPESVRPVKPTQGAPFFPRRRARSLTL